MERSEGSWPGGVIPPNRARAAIWWDSLWQILDERLGISAFAYPVPKYANNLPYILGGITAFGFLVLIVTGILLTQFYHPHPAQAYESVVFLITNTQWGDIIRGIHYWASNIVVVTLLLHLMRVFVTASYKRPREFNWWIGVGLFAVTLGLVFTGTVLKADQEGFEALAHNIEVAELLGTFGAFLSQEFSRSVPLLTRLYVGHIMVLPAALGILLLAHFYLIKHHGISPLPKDQAAPAPEMSKFTIHLRKMIGYGLMLLAVALVLSLIFPAPLGFPGVSGEEVTKPPWMFLWLYPLENVWGVRALLVAAFALVALLALVPLVDRSPFRSIGRRRAWLILGGGVLFVLVLLTTYSWITVPVSHLVE